MLSTHLARLRDSLALWADEHPLASVEADANGVEFIRSNCLERFDEWVTPDFRKATLQLQVAGHDGPANTLADAYGQCREFARRLDGLFADCLPVAPQYASEDAPFAIWTAEHGELDWLKCLAALGYAGAGPYANLLAVAEEIETAIDAKPPENASRPRQKRGPNTNAAMLDMLHKNQEARGWTVTQWQKALKKSRGAIAKTPTWKQLQEVRELNRAELALDRRRKFKPPSREK